MEQQILGGEGTPLNAQCSTRELQDAEKERPPCQESWKLGTWAAHGRVCKTTSHSRFAGPVWDQSQAVKMATTTVLLLMGVGSFAFNFPDRNRPSGDNRGIEGGTVSKGEGDGNDSKKVIPFHYPLFKQCNASWSNDIMVDTTICKVATNRSTRWLVFFE